MHQLQRSSQRRQRRIFSRKRKKIQHWKRNRVWIRTRSRERIRRENPGRLPKRERMQNCIQRRRVNLRTLKRNRKLRQLVQGMESNLSLSGRLIFREIL